MNYAHQITPAAQSYLQEPAFQYAPSQREIDFAQIVAAGGDIVEALRIASLVTSEEFDTTPRPTLYRTATRLLNTPAVQERIDYYRLLHQASLSVTVERIQQELACVAFSDPCDYFYTPEGATIDTIREVPRHARAAIKEWKIDKDGVLTVKSHDKLKAIRLLGDLQGYFHESDVAKAPKVIVALGDGAGALPNPPAPQLQPPPTQSSPTIPDVLK